MRTGESGRYSKCAHLDNTSRSTCSSYSENILQCSIFGCASVCRNIPLINGGRLADNVEVKATHSCSVAGNHELWTLRKPAALLQLFRLRCQVISADVQKQKHTRTQNR